jgi:hypothetical protein
MSYSSSDDYRYRVHAKGGARFAGATGRPDLVLLVIRSRSGSDAIVAASPPVTRIG